MGKKIIAGLGQREFVGRKVNGSMPENKEKEPRGGDKNRTSNAFKFGRSGKGKGGNEYLMRKSRSIPRRLVPTDFGKLHMIGMSTSRGRRTPAATGKGKPSQ